MIVGESHAGRCVGEIARVEESLGRPVNPTVYSVAEFNSKVAAGNHSLNSVLRGETVFVTGDERDPRVMQLGLKLNF